MSMIDACDRVIDTDVLVIGGGVSGLWAANKAAETMGRVVVVDKGPKDWGSRGSKSGGAMVAVVEPDSVTEFLEELVYYYDGLCDQDLWEEIFSQSNERIISDYQRLGYQWGREPDGSLKSIPQRGLTHFKCYLGLPFGTGGKSLINCLLSEADRLGVVRYGRVVITDIVKQNGAVAGAVGFDALSGQFFIFKARAVVIAVGNGGWKTSYHHNTSTGEHYYLGMRAGAEGSNCEFARVWNVPTLFAWEGQTHLLPLGAKFVNARGEAFMEKYSPSSKGNTDPHYTTRAMTIEAKAGKAPFYLDCSDMKPENRELITPKADWMALNHQKLYQMGINFFEDKIEWMPQMRQNMGGLRAEIDGQTKVPGLYVAGRARTVDPTVYIGGLSLLLCAVTGSIAGNGAAKFAAEREKYPLDTEQIKDFKQSLYASLGKIGIPPKEVYREIQKTVFPYDVSVLKNESSLKQALNRLEFIKSELLPQMAAKDAHFLVKSMEVRATCLMTELYLRTSLMREDSRAGHYREDYPNRDDDNWLSWVVASLDKDKIELRKEPLSIERYKVKPTRFYSDNFNF